MTKRVLVTGGTGLIGGALVEALRMRGDDVVVLRRGSGREGAPTWDPGRGVLDAEVLVGTDAVVSLNGAGIGDRRWTAQRKTILQSSRIEPVSLIAEAMAGMVHPPGVLVAGSATGYYGDAGDRLLDEGSPQGHDFLANLCGDWEAATDPAKDSGVRVVHARTGIVLSSDGGALTPLLPIFKAGLGGPIAGGTHWWSWITLADEVAALLFLIDRDISGPVNLVAPSPVRQREFAKALGAALGRPAIVPAPRFAVQARLGRDLASAIGYASQRVAPAVLTGAGFRFSYPDLDEALAVIFPR
jgi:uncharacterized protein (TIGR01777 family)